MWKKSGAAADDGLANDRPRCCSCSMNARVRRLRLLFRIQVWCESFQSRVKVLKLYIAGQTARPFAKEKFHMSAPFLRLKPHPG